MKKIVVDLDGVLRNLGIIFDKLNISTPTTWFWKHQNKDIYDWVAIDYNILLKAKPTKFFPIIKKYYGKDTIEIWSHQPKDWQPYTKQWIKKYIKNKVIIHWFTTDQKYKELKKRKNTILIEDSPNFPSYEQIILIDEPYNQKAKAKIRVRTPKQLERELKNI